MERAADHVPPHDECARLRRHHAASAAAYDVFGTGRTALKANVGKYLDAATNDSSYTENNPANRIQTTLTRGWTDNDGDRVVDCDILDPVSQSPTTTRSVEPRGDHRELAAFWQHADRSRHGQPGHSRRLGRAPLRLAVWRGRPAGSDAARVRRGRVNRRLWGTFTVSNNQALGANDFETWIATAPMDPRLPGGGGYQVVEYREATPEVAGDPDS